MLFGDSLFVQVLHGMKTDDPSYILRISKANGRTIWRQERPTIAQRESPDSYTTPAIVRHGNNLELVITGGDAVTGHDVNTGKELWRADVLNPTNDLAYRIVASPVVHGELIIAPTRERPMVVMQPGGRGDVAKSHIMWEFQNGPDVPTPVTDGTYVYVVNDRGIMWCLDAKTGKEIYGKQRLRPSTYSGSFTMADGKLYITNEDGLTTVLAHGAEVRDSRRERLRRLLAQLAGGLGRADLHSHDGCAVGDWKAEASPLVAFYRGDGRDHRGRSLSDIHEFDFHELEFNHDYIQWLFPLPEPSGANESAPVLSKEDIAAFESDDSLRRALLQSFEMMMRFYGLDLMVRDGDVEVVRSATFNERSAVWLTSGNHNFLRISRILRSLSLLGLDSHALAFLKCLEAIYAENARTIGNTTVGYWRRAVKFYLLLLAALLVATAAVHTQQPDIRIRAARVIDGTGQVRSNATVVVRGSRIAAIEPSSAKPVDIDLGQSTLLPGLIDVHAHIGWHFGSERPLRTSRADTRTGGPLRRRERVPHADGRIHDHSKPWTARRRRSA